MAQEALPRGVAPEAFWIESRSNSTAENILLSRALLAKSGDLPQGPTLLLVSAWWHLRRARALAAAAFGPQARLICCAHSGGPEPSVWASSPAGHRTLECERQLLVMLDS